MKSNKEIIISLLIAIPLVISQACYIFIDAKKRGEKYYFLWGLFGLLNVPSSLIVYLVVTRIILKKK